MSLEPASLGAALATPDGKRRYTRQVFATIADRYDLITRILSFGFDTHWKRQLVTLAGLGPRDRVLDLACGTGDLAYLTLPRVERVVGLDLTHVVQVRVYLRHFDRDYTAMNDAYATYFPPGRRPARTCVGVSGLAKGALIEIDMVARRP